MTGIQILQQLLLEAMKHAEGEDPNARSTELEASVEGLFEKPRDLRVRNGKYQRKLEALASVDGEDPAEVQSDEEPGSPAAAPEGRAS